jgi:hypothetical protein
MAAVSIVRVPTKATYHDLASSLVQALGGKASLRFVDVGPCWWHVGEWSGSLWERSTIFARLPAYAMFPNVTVRVRSDKLSALQPALAEFADAYPEVRLTIEDVDTIDAPVR